MLLETVNKALGGYKLGVSPLNISPRTRKVLIGISGVSLFFIAKFEMKKSEEKATIALKKTRLSMV